MSKKKITVIVVVVLLLVAAAGGGAWYLLRGGVGGAGNGDKVYVEQVSALMNQNSGVQNRFTGLVEPQKSWDVKKDPEKSIKEVFVKEGDTVEEGTPLFEYDMSELQDQIASDKLELEGIQNEIEDSYQQIENLKSERAAASQDMKFQYTTEIQSTEMSIKRSQYEKESKEAEIARKEESLNHAVVASEIAGVVKSITENGSDPYTGEELPYMTVLAVGDYRVKGTINEQNVWSLSEGMQVIVRSRIDEEQTWAGTITEIDTKNQVKDNSNVYYSDSGSAETASKYPFYIEMESVEGLILGQHVLIEMNEGQTEEKEGIWLYESYIVTEEEGGSYVWADNGKDRIEKRTVELGEYDAEQGMYQITSGLSEDDYITFPMAALYEGVVTVRDASEVDYESPMYSEEGSEGDDGLMQDGMQQGGEEGTMPEGSEMPEGGVMPEGGEMPEGGSEDLILDDGSTGGMDSETSDGSGDDAGDDSGDGGKALEDLGSEAGREMEPEVSE